MTSTQWLGDIEAKPAPGPLRLIQAFINTIDLESGQDRLANADDARPWLVENGLLAPGSVPTAADLRVLIDVREGLRALVMTNSGGCTPNPATIAPLRAVAEHGALRASLDERGRVSLVAEGDSIGARLLTLLLVIKDAQLDGTWTHMKACANDDCRWAFYDRSRNHGGTWCDMATCGNKLKNRDFRARHRPPR
ncbi:CGNR zinc finger domain-containing protein [Mycolicibacterium hodleri]|uniref:Zf-CGNR multi-domain protein n=1 Tax=Mycolicibacterium hodleri TaxID=49897 RepID=A0A502EBA4_9MYCO|nr:CGNR zinc finger domain-containing protein [Mycolicibacterium hodleri]TPG33711.1 zf-CGNR multi-domain protein [Mycolicibacterium hodleri]